MKPFLVFPLSWYVIDKNTSIIGHSLIPGPIGQYGERLKLHMGISDKGRKADGIPLVWLTFSKFFSKKEGLLFCISFLHFFIFRFSYCCFSRYSGGMRFVSHTPFADLQNLIPSLAIAPAATLYMTGSPWRFPTFVAVS